MLKRITDALYRITGRNAFIIALMVYAVFGLYVMPQGLAKIQALSGREVKVLDLQYAYTPVQARAWLSEYTDVSREYAARFDLVEDSVYPVVYTALFLVMISWLCRSLEMYGLRLRYLLLLPLAVMLIDYCENQGNAHMLRSYPYFSDRVAVFTSALTTAKWTLVGIEGLVLIVGVCVLVYYRSAKGQRR